MSMKDLLAIIFFFGFFFYLLKKYAFPIIHFQKIADFINYKNALFVRNTN